MVELLLDEAEHGGSFLSGTIKKLLYFSVNVLIRNDS